MKIDHLTIDEVSCFENSRGNGVIISWTADIGHGELTLYQRNEDDMWKADTQYMCTNEDKEFIRMVLNKWVDEIEVERMTREESIKRLDEQAFKELEEKIKFDKQTKKWFAKNFLGETTIMKCEKCGLFFKPSLGHKCKGEVMIDIQECVNKFIELEEKRRMQEMKQKELIKEAVMIMHPKHKGIVAQTGLKNVVFSIFCEEDKTYLITDEGLAQAIGDYQDSLYIKEK